MHKLPPGRRVVHLVGPLTDSVHRLLGPATDALGQAGCRQVVVLIQDPHQLALVKEFDPMIERVVLPIGPNPVARWRHWVRAVRHVLVQEPADIVHMHGFMASLLAGPLVARHAPQHRLYSPHDSWTQRSATHLQKLASLLLRPLLRRIAGVAVVAMPSEARVLNAVRGMPVAQLGLPVHDAYFEVQRQPARSPLVVGGVYDAPASTAARFVQLAVLMGAGEHDLAFNWLGPAWSKAREQLDAASIGVFDERSPASRAVRLAAAWVYVCPTATHGFPGHLAEAMACGLPVVAVDSPIHRDLLRDGETGFLCAHDAAFLDCVARLIEDEALRERMGRCARQEAQLRFGAAAFGSAVIEAYVPKALPADSTAAL